MKKVLDILKNKSYNLKRNFIEFRFLLFKILQKIIITEKKNGRKSKTNPDLFADKS